MTNPAGEVVTYIHTDGLGSPVARTDDKGNLISRTRYEPYGATAAGATPTIGFTGHVNDPDTGLISMQQRYYDPYAGRFLSTDPVLTDANTGSSFNRYVYANNNPFRYIDPDGRQASDPYCSTGGGCYSDGSERGSKDSGGNFGRLNPGAKTGFVIGGLAGAVFAGGCDLYTVGGCAPANPALVVGGAAGGAALGGYLGAMLSENSEKLAKALFTSGVSKDPHDATHHIVAATDFRAAQSRAILASHGMDINDAYNGINLDNRYHNRIHTNLYHNTVRDSLAGSSSYANVAFRLTLIRAAISAGMFPF